MRPRQPSPQAIRHRNRRRSRPWWVKTLGQIRALPETTEC